MSTLNMKDLFPFYRDVSQNQVSPKEAFAGKKKKLVRCLEFTEEKILPSILALFAVIYWSYAASLYFA